MQSSISRQLPALTAGLFVGVVLQEILISVFDLLNSSSPINAALIGLQPQTGWLTVLFGCWFIGGLTAGLMSSLIGHSMTTGCVAGVLLMIPALVLAQYAIADAAHWAALFTINPLIAAASGAWIAGKLGFSTDPDHQPSAN